MLVGYVLKDTGLIFEAFDKDVRILSVFQMLGSSATPLLALVTYLLLKRQLQFELETETRNTYRQQVDSILNLLKTSLNETVGRDGSGARKIDNIVPFIGDQNSVFQIAYKSVFESPSSETTELDARLREMELSYVRFRTEIVLWSQIEHIMSQPKPTRLTQELTMMCETRLSQQVCKCLKQMSEAERLLNSQP